MQLIDLHALHALLPTPPADYARPACLPVRSPLRELQQALMCYLADGICTGHIHRLKAQELFYVLRHYYTPAELATLLSPIAGNNLALPIGVVHDSTNNCEVEVCTNVVYGSVCVNVKLDYKTQDEWRKVLLLAFETYDRFGRR